MKAATEQTPDVCKFCGWPSQACACDMMDNDSDFGDDGDEFEEMTENCSGWFEEGSGRFVCGAVGSEDCDACPCYDWLGKTGEEIDAEDGITSGEG